jgi:hypothetical protein
MKASDLYFLAGLYFNVTGHTFEWIVCLVFMILSAFRENKK